MDLTYAPDLSGKRHLSFDLRAELTAAGWLARDLQPSE